jgi:hypothetical protein
MANHTKPKVMQYSRSYADPGLEMQEQNGFKNSKKNLYFQYNCSACNELPGYRKEPPIPHKF